MSDKFWDKVIKGPNCWVWTGCCNGGKNGGYGTLTINRKQYRAHRISWEKRYGPIPKGGRICHTCDNRKCVRPHHLFLGTQTDNLRDCSKKGRISRGEARPLSKLKIEQVKKIRKDTNTHTQIAKEYNISRQTVIRIKRRETWKHIV